MIYGNAETILRLFRRAACHETSSQTKRDTCLACPVSQMEARGIEPRSEHDSDTATTCVDLALVVSLPRRLVSPGSNKPLQSLAAPVEAPGATSPTLRYVSAASGRLPLTQVREAEAYAARASSELACV